LTEWLGFLNSVYEVLWCSIYPWNIAGCPTVQTQYQLAVIPSAFFLVKVYFLVMFCYVCLVLYGEERGVHRVLVGKSEGKRTLGRARRRWEDNIKMDLQDVVGGGGDWMESVQDRDRWRALVSTVKNLRVP
jgi:hypothetical protein